MNDTELMKKLKKLAIKETIPFCYSCYTDCPSGSCPMCFSDDLMRKLEDVGVEYGTKWVIDHLIENNVQKYDIENEFCEHIKAQYGDKVQIAFITTDLIEAIRLVDSDSWEMEKRSFISDLKLVGEVYEIKGTLYLAEKIEKYVNENLNSSLAT